MRLAVSGDGAGEGGRAAAHLVDDLDDGEIVRNDDGQERLTQHEVVDVRIKSQRAERNRHRHVVERARRRAIDHRRRVEFTRQDGEARAEIACAEAAGGGVSAARAVSKAAPRCEPALAQLLVIHNSMGSNG